jgi:hypothetical protein
LEGKGGEGFEKKEEISGRNNEVWEGRSFEGYFFFITQKPLNLGELKNCIGWGVWRVYMNSSNFINVVITFLNS